MTTFDILTGLQSGELDLLEYVTSLCDRIDSEDPQIRALVPGTYDRKRVLEDASKSRDQYPDPSSRPSLFGIPVGVKDIFRVDGFPTRCGSELPAELFEGREATCVSRLKRAGAIIMGKTVTTEFAFLEPGPTRNPHNLQHTPGGSSSGSAAGVASGFFPLALGTQTVGSVIRPAAYCGIVGFKPTFGRISTSGVIPFSHSADHVGILCVDLSRLGTFMSVLTDDWRPPDDESSMKVVLGVPEGPYLSQTTDSAREHFEKQLIGLSNARYEIRRIDTFGNIESVNDNHRRMIPGEMARVHSQWCKEYGRLYRPRTTEIIEQGLTVSDEELNQLRSKCLQLRANIEQEMESQGIDYWICPSATDHAPRGLESTGNPIMNLPWTSAGLPTISLPAGVDSDGLPHGIQLIGRYAKDEILISSARELCDILVHG